MRKRLKSIARALAALALLACLSGCSVPFADTLLSFRAEHLTAVMEEEGEMARGQSEEIIRCLTEGDKEGLAALFCPRVREGEDFSRQLDAAFDFFRCETYIKAQVQEFCGGGESMDGGERTAWYLSPEITYIEILQQTGDDPEDLADRYYGVRYFWQVTDAGHPDLEGLHHLDLALLNTDQAVEIGTWAWTED